MVVQCSIWEISGITLYYLKNSLTNSRILHGWEREAACDAETAIIPMIGAVVLYANVNIESRTSMFTFVFGFKKPI